jgi:DNA-binding HxlR family transcriptional regulator
LGADEVNWTKLTELLDTVDGKWDLGILANLEAGPMRPTDLCEVINDEVRETGHVLDPAVLTNTLRRMIDDGLIEHRELSRFPARVCTRSPRTRTRWSPSSTASTPGTQHGAGTGNDAPTRSCIAARNGSCAGPSGHEPAS